MECWGAEDDAALRKDLPISVTDESGKVIGLGKLQAGTYGAGGAWWECHFPFHVAGLPAAKVYGIQFGEHPIVGLTSEEVANEVGLDFNTWAVVGG